MMCSSPLLSSHVVMRLGDVLGAIRMTAKMTARMIRNHLQAHSEALPCVMWPISLPDARSGEDGDSVRPHARCTNANNHIDPNM
jgi:hypothetical protein